MTAFDAQYRTAEPVLRDALKSFREAYTEKTITYKQHVWSYYDIGNDDAHTILWLVGGLKMGDAAFRSISTLQSSFRIILPSYPSLSTMADLTDGLIAILDAGGVEKVSVLAGSYGGMIAQVLVRRYRDRVHKLILSTTSAPDTQKIEVYQQQRDMVAQSPDELVMQVACERMYGMINPMQNEENFWRAYLDELYMQRLTKNDLISTYDSILDYMTNYQFHPNDLRDWHGDILILDSDNDSVFDASARKHVNLLYPQAHAHTFIGAGHSPSSHRPDIYFDIVRKFLHE